jgi:arsenate reductase
MKKIYHLGTCNTCKRIISELIPGPEVELQDIKKTAITAKQLDEMKTLSGSYEALFTKRSMKFRAWNLKDKALTENDFRDLILKEYTFLKRPVIIIDDVISIGSAKSEIDKVRDLMK